MTTIILALMIPVSIAITGFLSFKALQLGLRWNIETKKEQLPTMEAPIKNPVTPIIEARQEKETASVFNEWVNGVVEER